MKLIDRLTGMFTPVKALPEGVYHLEALAQDQKPYRLHLRLQQGGLGILILNASTVLQLNPTAAEFAFHFIKGTPPERVAKEISSRYRIKKFLALQDYNDFVDKITALANGQDVDPVSILGFEQVQPNSSDLSSPLRLDCALTYRLSPGNDPIDAPDKRVDRELTTEEWVTVLDKAWAAGIPHVVFTGGEATLRDDLPALLMHAQKNGQVSGLLTDGLKLAEPAYLETLLQTGLDHLMVIAPVSGEPDWQMLKNLVDADIFLTVHQTITPQNAVTRLDVIEKLQAAGVENVSISLSNPSLQELASRLQSRAAELNLRLVSDLPVPYSDAHPVALEAAGDAEPAGAGRAWLYVEPDGDVLPAQGFADQILGNILKDSWEKIYSGGK